MFWVVACASPVPPGKASQKLSFLQPLVCDEAWHQSSGFHPLLGGVGVIAKKEGADSGCQQLPKAFLLTDSALSASLFLHPNQTNIALYLSFIQSSQDKVQNL